MRHNRYEGITTADLGLVVTLGEYVYKWSGNETIDGLGMRYRWSGNETIDSLGMRL